MFFFYCELQSISVKRNTYPDISVTLNELRVSKETPLQHGLQESQVDHVKQQQAQNGEVHYDGELKVKNEYWFVFLQHVYNPNAKQHYVTVKQSVN